MFDLEEIQSALVDFEIDGWLLYDFRGSNILARRILDLPEDAHTSRRYYYFIPASGVPQKLVHRIEGGVLDHLPGDKNVYLAWRELEESLGKIVGKCQKIAMEYSPRCANPYVSRVDGGTIELVRCFGPEVVSSGDLVQLFESNWSSEEWQMHQQAGVHTDAAFAGAWSFIAERVRAAGAVRETDVQRAIMDHFAATGLVTDHPPIVGVGPHSGDPHYAPCPGSDAEMKQGDFVLIDLWAKLDKPGAVYSDMTRVGFIGTEVPPKYETIFQIVAQSRDAAIELVRDSISENRPLGGWEVDRAARDVIEQAGYGEFFVHRLGHSIGQETHGNGANMDNLETRDERRVLRGACFSIEPGIYMPEFGVRSEVNVYISPEGEVHVTAGELQQHVIPILDF